MYKRILLKLSGEVLAGEQGHGIDFDMVTNVCTYVKKVADMGFRLVSLSEAETSGAEEAAAQ